jgi:hypothetical protein
LDWGPIASGVDANLNSYIETSIYRMAVGDGGTVIKSTDGGFTWTPRVSGTGADLYDVRSAESSGDWLLACGADGTVIRSSNAGETWCLLDTGVTADLHAVWPITHLRMFAFGEGGIMIRSDDGGGGCLDPSDIPLETEDACTSLVVMPNPMRTSGRFAIDLPNPRQVRARLLDASGRSRATLHEGWLNPGTEVPFEIEPLPSGVYFLSIDGPGVAQGRTVQIIR